MERQNCKVYFKELLLAIFAKNIYAEDMVRLLGKQLGDVEACPLVWDLMLSYCFWGRSWQHIEGDGKGKSCDKLEPGAILNSIGLHLYN